MTLRREPFETEYLDPRRGFDPTRVRGEVRWDPLTGRTARLLPEGTIPPPVRHDLDALAASTRDGCPFCTDAIERATPRFLASQWPEGRIRRGAAVLFPNLVAYANWSSVSVYSPELHLLPLDAITPSLLADNLATQVEFLRATRAQWQSVNANHLPSSGSSIVHPHLQGAASAAPTNAQRMLAELPAAALREYVELEREGERHIGSNAGVDWLASFAPAGVGEVRALGDAAGSPAELEQKTIDELARGVVAVLQTYAELGFESFNFALTGLPLVLRLVARAYFAPTGRSDVMWSERLHEETATDLAPERLAALVRRSASP